VGEKSKTKAGRAGPGEAGGQRKSESWTRKHEVAGTWAKQERKKQMFGWTYVQPFLLEGIPSAEVVFDDSVDESCSEVTKSVQATGQIRYHRSENHHLRFACKAQ